MTHGVQGNARRGLKRGCSHSARRTVGVLTFAVALLGLIPDGASGQLTVESRLDLRFGLLIPGVATAVQPNSRQQAGHFRIRGPRNTEVEVIFALPAEMVSAVGGFTIPLSFGAGDAVWSGSNNPGSGIPFDPTLPQTIVIQNPPMINIFIGGTATPTASQRGGNYQGTITLTVATVSN